MFEKLVRVLHRHLAFHNVNTGVVIPLVDELTDLVENLAQDKLEEARNDGYLTGKEVGLRNGFNQGEAQGIARKEQELNDIREHSSRQYQTLQTLAKMYARTIVEKIVTEETIDTKIQNIKNLRNSVPGMGLKEAKDIVDEYTEKVKERITQKYIEDLNKSNGFMEIE